jgi:hypothetical protein
MYKHNTITNHGFLKGSTWLKCSHWQKKKYVLIFKMGNQKHMVLLVGF